MKRLYPILIALCICGCKERLISIEREELLRKEGVDICALASSASEKEALEFLYANMSLGDIANYSPEFHLQNVRLSQQARATMKWGKQVPEREFRHFVLPTRINNENLDSCRAVFLSTLAPIVKDMDIRDAILEVNHWCHQHVVYQPTDSRTSAPLSTIRTAYGRCGEESTLLVAALRAVGIPARQVYTPRWAHTDDNHAWVEAWAGDGWHFLGACEPEPVLDLAWFNAPASRGMLMSTNVFGKYNGPEECLNRTALHTTINVTSNYAPVSKLRVKVVDAMGQPLSGASVSFCLYNYAEFYPLCTKTTSKRGLCSFTSGLGDLMLYVVKGELKAFCKARVAEQQTVTITLDSTELNDFEVKLTPPCQGVNIPEVSRELRDICSERMACEDSIRRAYTGTFRNDNIYLEKARGNHSEIALFLEKAKKAGRTALAHKILDSISEKDLRDTPCSVLEDHLMNTPADAPEMVLCPRVSVELLGPWRSYLQKNLPQSMQQRIRSNAADFVLWCKDSLELYSGINSRYTPVRVEKVWEHRVADAPSRDLFFVAALRSCGVQAWKDPVSGKLRYAQSSTTYDVDFEESTPQQTSQGTLTLDLKTVPGIENPKYYSHFSICAATPNGFQQLEFSEQDTYQSLFSKALPLDCGDYMLVSGTRMAGGDVCSAVSFFSISEGENTHGTLRLITDPEQLMVKGSFDSEALYTPYDILERRAAALPVSILSTTGRGYFAVALIDHGSEPTVHALKDISSAAEKLQSWGRPLLLIFSSEKEAALFCAREYSLPSNIVFGIDMGGSLRAMIAENMHLKGQGTLPLVVLADTFNRVVFFTEGYTIGLGDSLVKTTSML